MDIEIINCVEKSRKAVWLTTRHENGAGVMPPLLSAAAAAARRYSYSAPGGPISIKICQADTE